MMLKTPFFIFIFILIFIFSPVNAETGSERGAKLKLDFSERFRLISWDNPITLDSSEEEGSFFTRNRTSLGLLWKPFSDLDIYFKATNEFRYYFKPEGRDFNINEIFVDNLYFRLKNICDLPLTITAGRQNLFFGEGFIVVDGGPLDGSRSSWFDAFRTDISFNDHGKLSFFYLSTPEQDNFLPIINGREQLLNEYPHRGFGFYYSGKWEKNDIELYYIKKLTDTNGDDLTNINYGVAGSRIKHPLTEDFSITGEIAYQYGNKDSIPISAGGGYFYFQYHPFSSLPRLKKIKFGVIYLSGDNPATRKIEGWDPVFSRWPKWSESYIYTLIRENGAAMWSNFSSLFLTLDIKPVKRGNLHTGIYYLMAPAKGCKCSLTGGNGKTRGTLLIGRFNYKLNRFLSGHIVYEHFKPGNFYFEGAESYNWFRVELMYKIK